MIKTKVMYLCGALALLLALPAQAAPFFQAAGASANGTGSITVAWPAHAVNDVALLFVESSGGQAVTLSTPSGFVQVTGSPQATGSGSAGAQLTVFWARATSTAMPSVTVADPGDHVYARIITYRGVISTGSPWDVTAGGIKSTASTTVTVTGVTTTVADTLIVQAVARDRDSTNAHFSAETNVNLASIAERSDAGTTSGNGGGFAVWDGVFAGTGATGNTTATISNSVVNAFITIALKPVAGSGSVTSSPSSCSTQTGVGTVAWATPLDAVSSNNIYATASNVRGNVTTNYLNCTGFNFSAVPAGAVITGITVYAERRTSGGTIRDRFVYLIKGGTISTAFNAATATNYPTTDTIEAHGGPSNMWGTSWSEAEVKAVNFGVALASYNVSTTSTNNRTVRVDHIQVRVDYTQPALHHIRIEHDGSASTCAPEAITLKACFNAACTPPHYTTTDVTGVNLAPTGGTYTWTPASTVSISAASGGVNSSVTIARSNAGTASLAISGTPSPAPANAFVCYNTATLSSGAGGSAACNLVFSNNTFSFSVPDHSAVTRQVVTMTSCTSNFANTSRSVRFWSSYINPATGTLQGRVAAGTGNADCTTAYSAMGSSLASAASLSLAFGAGVAPQATFSLCYPDAGEMRLDARYDGSNTNTPNDNGVVILGNDNYISAPASFSFSGIACNTVGATTCAPANGAGTNPAAADASGGAFIQAGQPFRATVSALNALGAVTPNFGRETSPEIIALQPVSNASPCPATSSCLIAPAGAAGNLAGAFASAGAGTGAVSTTDANWDEVGIIQLRAANTSYLGSTLNVYGLSGNVGRFIPDHFEVTPDATTPIANRTDICDTDGLLVLGGAPCTWPAYTFMGERMDTQFTLTAQALSNTTTQNYTGTFAKLNPLATNATLAFAAIDTAVPTYLTARLDTSLITTAGSGSFISGVADIVAPISISRGAAADGPYAALNIGIAPLDSDSITTVFDLDTDATAGDDHALIGITEVRYGRTRISNGYGSELLALSLPIVSQYWNGSSYVTNTDDNLSVFPLALGNYQNYLNMGETTLTLPVIVNGRGLIGFSAPGAGNNGSVDVTVTSPAYLPGNAGRATFGVYKGNNNFIYQREAY